MNRSFKIAVLALAAATSVACGPSEDAKTAPPGPTEATETQLPQHQLGDVVRVQGPGNSALDVILTGFQKDPDLQAKIASGAPGVSLVNPMPEGAELWRLQLEVREVSGLPKVSGSEPRLKTAEGTEIQSALLVDGSFAAFQAATMVDGQVIKGVRWYIVPKGETPAKFVWIRNGVPKDPLAEWPL